VKNSISSKLFFIKIEAVLDCSTPFFVNWILFAYYRIFIRSRLKRFIDALSNRDKTSKTVLRYCNLKTTGFNRFLLVIWGTVSLMFLFWMQFNFQVVYFFMLFSNICKDRFAQHNFCIKLSHVPAYNFSSTVWIKLTTRLQYVVVGELCAWFTAQCNSSCKQVACMLKHYDMTAMNQTLKLWSERHIQNNHCATMTPFTVKVQESSHFRFCCLL
jgi:hypothetical protein